MKKISPPGLSVNAGTDVDQFLDAVPSKTSICKRLDQLEREKKTLKKLLRIAHSRDAEQEVSHE